MGEIKNTTFRLDKDITDKFKVFCEENHLTANQGFSNIMQTLELDNAKKSIPDRQTEIEHFQSLTVSLIAAFMNSLEINANAENRIRQEFSVRLDADAETIAALQKENKKIKEEAENLKKETTQQIDNVKNEASDAAASLLKMQQELERVTQQLADKIQDIDTLKKTNTLLNETLTFEKKTSESLKTQILHEKDYKDISEQLKKDLMENKKSYENIINEMSLNQLKEITKLEKALQEAQAQIELVKAKAEAEKAIAILTETRKLSEKIEILMEEQQKQRNIQIEPLTESKETQ